MPSTMPTIKFRASAEEKLAIEAMARSRGMPVSAFVHDRVLKRRTDSGSWQVLRILSAVERAIASMEAVAAHLGGEFEGEVDRAVLLHRMDCLIARVERLSDRCLERRS